MSHLKNDRTTVVKSSNTSTKSEQTREALCVVVFLQHNITVWVALYQLAYKNTGDGKIPNHHRIYLS